MNHTYIFVPLVEDGLQVGSTIHPFSYHRGEQYWLHSASEVSTQVGFLVGGDLGITEVYTIYFTCFIFTQKPMEIKSKSLENL